MSNIVAIVGRPNVGKSTFFNRLIQQRNAIVDATAGVTRDRIYGKTDWNGRTFSVIDTGGYITGSDDVFEADIRKQVILAVEEANLILFLVDAQLGLTDMDKEVAHVLRQTDKKVILVANKVDSSSQLALAAEFYSLGLGDYFAVSAINGSGSGELLDEVVKQLPDHEVTTEEDLPKFAVVGRPNAGKSSFINTLIGEDRNIVTDVAGTTRDSIHTLYNQFGNKFYLVDTAGIRKKSKVHENLEFYSVMRAVRSIEHADVCFLMLDASRGIEAQDINIFSLIVRNFKGVVILVNKWDLIEKQTQTMEEYRKAILKRIEPFTDIPILFVSVLEKQRIFKAIEEGVAVYERRSRRIPTSKLNDVMLDIISGYPPPAVKGKYVKIKYCTMLPTETPRFAFYCNLPQYIREPYKRFIENQLRKNFDLSGVPIEIYFRKK
ncbi:MAG: ribosome biogenesis GTPase Der [Cryomorphaceae bacterium]|nr:ribosome biogenesis GTPase Der [Cryomorphaceae bacterium]